MNPSSPEKKTEGPIDQNFPFSRVPSGGTIALPSKTNPPAVSLIEFIESNSALKLLWKDSFLSNSVEF